MLATKSSTGSPDRAKGLTDNKNSGNINTGQANRSPVVDLPQEGNSFVALSEEQKQKRVETILKHADFIRFNGALLYRTNSETPPDATRTKGYERVTEDNFAGLVYRLYPGILHSNLKDLLKQIQVVAPDKSELSKYIGFRDKVWDMEKLDWTDETIDWVYATDIAPQPPTSAHYKAAKKYLVQLAAGDEDLALDYAQALAPLFMQKKPAGVIWFVGDGANGKSSLINAIYRIFGKYFSSLTVAAIEDGRDTPRLNGVLGNICRESSEARVEDTERYKAIGTHEPFFVHKFHSQDAVEVIPNCHTIFNANNIPVFSDKTQGARRRTLIIPFPAHFADDPTFEDRTFTPEFLGGLLTLILDAAKQLAEQGCRYQFSDATLKAKEAYDSEVNSAEAFLSYLEEKKIKGFMNYTLLKINYENWCSQNGFIPLGLTTLRRVMTNEAGAERRSIRIENGKVANRYFFARAENELVWLDDGYGVSDPTKEELQPSNERLSDEW